MNIVVLTQFLFVIQFSLDDRFVCDDVFIIQRLFNILVLILAQENVLHRVR